MLGASLFSSFFVLDFKVLSCTLISLVLEMLCADKNPSSFQLN